MDVPEQKLFKSISIGMMFRIGFQCLLTDAARQRGRDAGRWLDEFEARVVADARRMTPTGSVSEKLVQETIDAAAAEFTEVFAEVRKALDADGPPPSDDS